MMARPLPLLDNPTTAAYWAAAGRHEFMVPSCAACGTHFFPPRPVCPSCGSDEPGWVAASGRGSVYSYTVARRPTHPAFADRVPYVIAVVELDEGPRLTTNIDCDPAVVSIGMDVEVAFEDVAAGVALPVFRPARAEEQP